jgi:hypothetical protein
MLPIRDIAHTHPAATTDTNPNPDAHSHSIA